MNDPLNENVCTNLKLLEDIGWELLAPGRCLHESQTFGRYKMGAASARASDPGASIGFAAVRS
jgi:hypothetical protein